MNFWGLGIALAERGWVPDVILRAAIRRLCGIRLQELQRSYAVESLESHDQPLAIETDLANEQHYEVPVEYFELVLGRRQKYSCNLWEDDNASLDQAEELALRRVCTNAAIQDGQRILDLGCGWGSMTLWLAEHYPTATIVAVSNSARQRESILSKLAKAKLSNVEVLTLDVGQEGLSRLQTMPPFDRVVSIEMIEHVRNHDLLLEQLHKLLVAEGLLYFHFFCHARHSYFFEDSADDDWITRYFFRGGMMPSRALFDDPKPHFKPLRQWEWSGRHYQQTAEAWLRRHDAERTKILTIFARHYGSSEAQRWFVRWRIFYLAVAELFGYRQGNEWQVRHCLLQKRLN
jgi:cyclopropane-fatty-acyl-phospholipid synthase